MARKPRQPAQPPDRRQKGFEAASALLTARIRAAGEKRGFAVTRLLTRWAEIVGDETARMARPVKISYAQSGFGATLTLLTTGAAAPMMQMRLPQIRERVNACYGYNAISHIRLTQTAPTGFAEGRAQFTPAPAAAEASPDPEVSRRAADAARDVRDDGLRAALEALGQNVLSRNRHVKGIQHDD
ncbi:DUF721 domain-containing protein [Rhodobacteraceae bacterium WD3A24]|nr:DUF721 domain-containing protein [Rhodobacteraceae bacterium WD3A24]